MQCVAVLQCCRVLQCYSALQCVVYRRELQCVAVCCSVLQCVAVLTTQPTVLLAGVGSPPPSHITTCAGVLPTLSVSAGRARYVALLCSRRVLELWPICEVCGCIHINVWWICTSAAVVCVAVCCSVLQCVAVCCSVLQRVQTCKCVADMHECGRGSCCSVLQCDAVCCSVLQYVAVCCSGLQWVAVCCSVLQCVPAGANM